MGLVNHAAHLRNPLPRTTISSCQKPCSELYSTQKLSGCVMSHEHKSALAVIPMPSPGLIYLHPMSGTNSPDFQIPKDRQQGPFLDHMLHLSST